MNDGIIYYLQDTLTHYCLYTAAKNSQLSHLGKNVVWILLEGECWSEHSLQLYFEYFVKYYPMDTNMTGLDGLQIFKNLCTLMCFGWKLCKP